MFIGKVIGTMVATEKDPSLQGIKLMIVQPLDEDGKATGDPLVATDSIGIGVGELGFCVLGREAALALPDTFAPVDAGIIGIVDRYDVEKRIEQEGTEGQAASSPNHEGTVGKNDSSPEKKGS